MDVDKTNTQKIAPKKILRTVVPLILGIAILYYLYRGIDCTQMWSVIKDANYGILACSLVFGFLANIIRGLRWELMISPLGYKPKRWNLIYAILGNHAVNFLIPLAGEIWRCAVITKEENVPFPKLLGTMVIDSLSDIIAVFCMLVVILGANSVFLKSFLLHNQDLFNTFSIFTSSIWLYLGVGLFIVVIILIFTVFRNFKIMIKMRKYLIGVGHNIQTIWRMKQKKQFLLFTVGIWVSYFLYFYITFFAFHFTLNLGIVAGLVAFAISSISMGIPTNGGMGVWHVAVIAVLSIYGVQTADAIAFATTVFTIQSVFVILCGIFGIIALGSKKKTHVDAKYATTINKLVKLDS